MATGLLNDVGNPVRVNVEESYRRGLELEGGVQLTPEVRLDANATLSENKIADFEEIVYDYGEGFDYVNVVNHRNTTSPFPPMQWRWGC